MLKKAFESFVLFLEVVITFKNIHFSLVTFFHYSNPLGIRGGSDKPGPCPIFTLEARIVAINDYEGPHLNGWTLSEILIFCFLKRLPVVVSSGFRTMKVPRTMKVSPPF